MHTREISQFLQTLPLFSGLKSSDIQDICQHTTPLHFSPQQIIIHEGQNGSDVFFVTEGKLKVFKKGFGGEEVELATLREGNMFGELAFIDKLPRSVTISAHTQATILKITGETFANILKSHEHIFPKFLDDVVMKFRMSNDAFYKKMLKKNQELKTAYDQLKTLDEQKSKFIGLASHEIKTPLAVMIGNLDLINDGLLGDLPDKAKSAIHKISQRSKKLGDIIQQIINVSLKNDLHATFVKQEVTVNELIQEVLADVGLLLTKRKLDLHYDASPRVTLQADQDKLKQIIMNLVLNAIRFTPDGGRIQIKLEKGKMVLVSVKDTGIGIPEKDLELIFLPFYTGGNIQHHTSGLVEFGSEGIGLGLTIAKNFATQHGGHIEVVSSPNQGSEFILCLPKSAR